MVDAREGWYDTMVLHAGGVGGDGRMDRDKVRRVLDSVLRIDLCGIGGCWVLRVL